MEQFCHHRLHWYLLTFIPGCRNLSCPSDPNPRGIHPPHPGLFFRNGGNNRGSPFSDPGLQTKICFQGPFRAPLCLGHFHHPESDIASAGRYWHRGSPGIALAFLAVYLAAKPLLGLPGQCGSGLWAVSAWTMVGYCRISNYDIVAVSWDI